MRLLGSLVAALALLSFSTTLDACAPELAGDTMCARAAHRFNECGASLPALEGATCSATQKALATCITMNASSCEELASLYRRIDVCVAGLLEGNELDETPIEELPTSLGAPADAGPDQGGGGFGITPQEPPAIVLPIDAGVDASLPNVDAGTSSPTSALAFSLDGSISLGAARRWVTGTLQPGTYVFAITGSGDADLYVRVGAPVTTTAWTCRPYLEGSVETCTVTLEHASNVFVMLRGIAVTSNFTLEGRP